jgi:formylglycine-generating enzyme required for sulfatase activity
MEKPSWAQGWGRDEQGLFVILPHGEQTRKAYWFTPGKYPVGEHTDSSIDIHQGFWWDKHDFRRHVCKNFQKPDWAYGFGVDKYGIYAEFNVRSAVQRMRWIMPGEFMMGSPQSEPERFDGEQQHEVILTRGFWLADTACTQALWQAVMSNNPSDFKGEDHPVDSVNWDDVQTFLGKINGDIPGLELHLPTEAQWEYACRAGTTTPFHFGDNITTDQVNFNGNYPYNKGAKGEYRRQTVPAKSFACNDWGLHEMHGNVWEWCADWYGKYPQSTVVDPSGPEKGDSRVLRGGSWIGYAGYVRSAYRPHFEPADRGRGDGFRVARSQTESKLPGGAGQSKGASEKIYKSRGRKESGLMKRFLKK